jgi:hypothetical protein
LRAPSRPARQLRAFLLAFAVMLGGADIARAADGILKVRSNVAAAEVWVDGQSLGPVPVTRFLAPGSHAVRVVADNFDPYVRKVDVQDGKTTDVNATLVAGTGTAEFVGAPASRLEVDGHDRGALPIRLSDLAPGPHVWKVTSPKFEPAEGTLLFLAGKNYLVNVPTVSSAGVLVVDTSPSGATVLLDGKDVGVTPLRLEGVPLGVHGLVLKAADRATVVRTVDTTDGSRGQVTASLPSGGSIIKVTTGSATGKVFLNGTPIGEGATVKFGPVEKGRAQVAIEVDGDRASASFNLPASGTLLLHRSGDAVEKQKPLVARWGFWAAVGGGVAVGAGAGIATATAVQPEPAPSGDTVVTLP